MSSTDSASLETRRKIRSQNAAS